MKKGLERRLGRRLQGTMADLEEDWLHDDRRSQAAQVACPSQLLSLHACAVSSLLAAAKWHARGIDAM